MKDDNQSDSRIPFRQALQTLVTARQDSDVIVTNQGSSRVWPLIENHSLDFHFNPSTMGGAISLALGIALAQPQRRVIVLSGDGSLLMNPGSLVSVIASRSQNLSVILLDNDLYDVTGGQKTAASDLDVRFDDIARSIGFNTVAAYRDAESWKSNAVGFLQSGSN
jgi:thiamine pyrophosphate-dependent acetolactate synthase large subunit-like protein